MRGSARFGLARDSRSLFRASRMVRPIARARTCSGAAPRSRRGHSYATISRYRELRLRAAGCLSGASVPLSSCARIPNVHPPQKTKICKRCTSMQSIANRHRDSRSITQRISRKWAAISRTRPLHISFSTIATADAWAEQVCAFPSPAQPAVRCFFGSGSPFTTRSAKRSTMAATARCRSACNAVRAT